MINISKINNNISKKVKKYILVATTTTMIATMTGCAKNDELQNMRIIDVIEKVKDNTCLDETILYTGLNMDKVNTLEEYLALSKELKKMDFARFEVSTLKNVKLKTPEDIRTLIEEYEKTKDFYFISGKHSIIELSLSNQENLVNKYLCDNGYDIMYAFLSNIAKAKILDANNLDENSYNNVEINSARDGNVLEPENHSGLYVSFDVNGETIKSRVTDYMYSFVNKIYEIEGYADNKVEFQDAIEYNSKRNKMLEEAIDMAKMMIKADVELVRDIEWFIPDGYKTKTKKR